MGDKYTVVFGKPEGIRLYEKTRRDLEASISKKQNVRLWAVFKWLRIGSIGGLF
jgi:hypothetical protein